MTDGQRPELPVWKQRSACDSSTDDRQRPWWDTGFWNLSGIVGWLWKNPADRLKHRQNAADYLFCRWRDRDLQNRCCHPAYPECAHCRNKKVNVSIFWARIPHLTTQKLCVFMGTAGQLNAFSRHQNLSWNWVRNSRAVVMHCRALWLCLWNIYQRFLQISHLYWKVK